MRTKQFTKLIAFTALAATSELSRLDAQLYVIAGSPSPRYNEGFAATLVRIGDDGRVSDAKELIPAKSGLEWVTISEDARKAILLPKGQSPILVLDLNSASVVKACIRPAVPMALIDQWLVNSPARGFTFIRYLSGSNPKDAQLTGLLLDETIPCDRSFVNADTGDLLGVLALGRTGVTDTGNVDGMTVSLDLSGKVTRRILGTDITFPFAIPEEMRSGLREPLASILISNSSFVAIGLFEKAGTHRILVYRKHDQTWYRVPIAFERVLTADGRSTPIPWATGFGNFMALTQIRTKDAQLPESVGKVGWRRSASATGPNLADRFGGEEVAFPGLLSLYDVVNDRVYTIHTDQADSEILLVQGRTVYYRIGDELYRASIGGTSLSPAQLTAKAEILRDAHWAFIRQ